MVMNTACHASNSRQVPITVVNTTNKWFCLNKGNVVAKANAIDPSEVYQLTLEPNPTPYDKSPPPHHSDETLDLTPDEQRQLDELLAKNDDIFSKDEYDLGRTHLLEAVIDTGDSPPVRKKPYRTPLAYREEVRNQIREMLAASLISPSNSSYAAPIICIKKRTGGVRIVADYRGLNDVTKKFYWPLANST